VALPKRKLAAGDYRAVVTPVDAAGNRGAKKTVSFRVTKK
jgi:DNA-binding cell septation regulator SpoVG